MSKQPTPEQKEIYRFIDSAFDGGARVREYIHDTEPLSIYIVSKADCPWQGVTSYCTIDASDVETQFQDGKVPVRVEFAGMCDTAEVDFPYGLRTRSWNISKAMMTTRWKQCLSKKGRTFLICTGDRRCRTAWFAKYWDMAGGQKINIRLYIQRHGSEWYFDLCKKS